MTTSVKKLYQSGYFHSIFGEVMLIQVWALITAKTLRWRLLSRAVYGGLGSRTTFWGK